MLIEVMIVCSSVFLNLENIIHSLCPVERFKTTIIHGLCSVKVFNKLKNVQGL